MAPAQLVPCALNDGIHFFQFIQQGFFFVAGGYYLVDAAVFNDNALIGN